MDPLWEQSMSSLPLLGELDLALPGDVNGSIIIR